MLKTCIIACVKQEELYIKEWLDWHIKFGVDHFYLCDNNDKDYNPKLKYIVSEYIEREIVDVIDYNDIHPIQPICYNDIYQKYGNLYDWILIIDIDEFLSSPIYTNIKNFLNTVPNNIFNIGLPWRYYGDNELIEYENKPLQERFKKPVDIWKFRNGFYYHEFINGYKSNVMSKSIIRSKKYFKSNNIKIISQHDPLPLDLNYEEYKRYDPLFNEINRKTVFCNSLENDRDKYFNILYNTLYIKHFVTKTIDEWVFNKIKKGHASRAKNEDYERKLGSFFVYNYYTEEKKKFLYEKYKINYNNE